MNMYYCILDLGFEKEEEKVEKIDTAPSASNVELACELVAVEQGVVGKVVSGFCSSRCSSPWCAVVGSLGTQLLFFSQLQACSSSSLGVLRLLISNHLHFNSWRTITNRCEQLIATS